MESVPYKDGGKVDNEIIQAMTCPVCCDVFEEPHSLKCGHSFCFKCLSSKERLLSVCPLCRVYSGEKLVMNFALRDLVEALSVNGKNLEHCSECDVPCWHAYRCRQCPAAKTGLLCELCAMNGHSRLGHHVARYFDEEARMEQMVKSFDVASASAILDCMEQVQKSNNIESALIRVLDFHRSLFLSMQAADENNAEIRKYLCNIRMSHLERLRDVINDITHKLVDLAVARNEILSKLLCEAQNTLFTVLSESRSAGWHNSAHDPANELLSADTLFEYSLPPLSPSKAQEKRRKAAISRRSFFSRRSSN